MMCWHYPNIIIKSSFYCEKGFTSFGSSVTSLISAYIYLLALSKPNTRRVKKQVVS